MSEPLRILIIDDSEDDTVLLVRHLRASGYAPDYRRIDTQDELRTALSAERWDLVICDYSMPQLSAPKALRIIQSLDRDVPVILVSGFVGEDELIRLIKIGAQDIILKSNLARLKPAIERELAEAQLRRDKQRAKAQLTTAIESIAEGIALYDADDRLVVCNRKYRELHDGSGTLLVPGVAYEDLVRDAVRRGSFVLEEGEDAERFIQQRLEDHVNPGTTREIRRSDGRWLKAQEWLTPDGGTVCVVGDITGRREREERLRSQAEELRRSNDQLSQEVALRKATEISLSESESLARAIFDGAADGLVTFGADGVIESVNPAAARMFGLGPDEAVGLPLTSLLPEGLVRRTVHAREPAWQATADAGGTPREILGRRRDGSPVPIEWTVSEVARGEDSLFAGIMRDITERKKLDRMKSEFVSVVSHELRTPLTSIRGALGLLQAQVTGDLPEQARGMIEIAHANCERIIRLLNDILDIEKIESGRMHFEFQPLAVADLLRHSVEACRGYADQFGVGLRIEREGSGLVMADRDRFGQIVANLLSNAIKYSPPGETVTIDARAGAGSVRVSVRDRGPGIPAEFHERIFEKFSQADSSDTRQKGGSGLGLSIAEAIIERHGGKIGFHTAPGRGTTFFFDLPLKRVGARTHMGIGAPSSTVLVCGGEARVRDLMQQSVVGLGFDAVACADTGEAEAFLAERPVAALLLDVALLDGAGVAFARGLRAAAAAPAMPIIATGAAAGRGGRLRGRALTLVDWLFKPVDLPRLRIGAERAADEAGGRGAPILCIGLDDALRSPVTRMVRDLGPARFAATRADIRAAGACGLAIVDVPLGGRGGEAALAELFANAEAGPPLIILSEKVVPARVAKQLAGALRRAALDEEAFARQLGALLDAVHVAADMRLMA